MTNSIARLSCCAGAVVALLSVAMPAQAQTEERDIWSAAVGVSLLSTSLGSGSGFQAEIRKHAFYLTNLYTVDYTLSGAFGSAGHNPFRCVIARQFYCFGGTERIKTAGVGLTILPMTVERFFGFDVTPRVLFGVGATHVFNSELEGPTASCIDGKVLVSCPDNPPFQTLTGVTTRVMPAVGSGLSLARKYGRLNVALDLTAYQVGWRNRRQGRAGAGVQFQLVR